MLNLRANCKKGMRMYGIQIDKNGPDSILKQICQQMRAMIDSGELAAGTRLLSTRLLAKEWNIARNLVIEAYEQLSDEGYLEGRVGSGTYVAQVARLSTNDRMYQPDINVRSDRKLQTAETDVIDFMAGIPDIDSFPCKQWAKYLKEAAEIPIEKNYDNALLFGDMRLRQELRSYLFRSKGIRCSAEHIIIVSGSSEGVLLAGMVFKPQYHAVYLEDPTISFTRNIFEQMNYQITPVPVDKAGMNVDSIDRFEARHLVLVTPSHQFPSGSLFSIQRRKKTIQLAIESDAYILEDDYDSEFRLKGVPVPPLYTLDPHRVVYIGTFSKTLAPSLRIGFLLVPPALIEAFASMKESLNLLTPLVTQRALAGFLADGHFERHLYTMRKIYKKRRQALVECLQKYFGSDIAVMGDEAGMHLRVCFLDNKLKALTWNHVESFGIRLETCREYALSEQNAMEGIILGYGNLSLKDINEGIHRLYRYTVANGYYRRA